MQKRNQYLVEHADFLIALFNGEEGCTKQSIELSFKKGLK